MGRASATGPSLSAQGCGGNFGVPLAFFNRPRTPNRSTARGVAAEALARHRADDGGQRHPADGAAHHRSDELYHRGVLRLERLRKDRARVITR